MINRGFSKLRKRYNRYRNNALIVKQLEDSFFSFFRREASGGMILLFVSIIALIFANVQSLTNLSSFWTDEFTFSINKFSVTSTLKQLVNKGFVSVYFFIIALELKRLFFLGELQIKKVFILPIISAIGGIIISLSIYTLFNIGSINGISGWILLVGTDISIIAGLVMFMGNSIPTPLKLFIISTSIITNLIGITLLSIIYPTPINIMYIIFVIALLVFLYLLNRSGFKSTLVYSLFGILLWIFVYKAGLHPAISGLLLAIVIPTNCKINQVRLLVRGRHLLSEFKESYNAEINMVANRKTQEIIESMSQGIDQARSPMHRLGKSLHPFVIFIVIPLFILANVDINLKNISSDLSSSMSVGLIIALVIGKPLGILLPFYNLIKFGFIKLSDGVTWRHIIAASFLMGISFSISLFSADVVLSGEILRNSKLAILVASIISGLLGLLLFKFLIKRN